MSQGSTTDTDRTEAAVAVSGRPAAAEPKGSINLRIDANTGRMIDDAAEVLGKTRTEFMIEIARREAIDVLLDRRLFALKPVRYDTFVRTLDEPPAPGPKLRSLRVGAAIRGRKG